MDTVELLKESGISVTPDNLQLQELFQTFAEAVAGRGDARWQAYFIHTTPYELAKTFLESTTSDSQNEDEKSFRKEVGKKNSQKVDKKQSFAADMEELNAPIFTEEQGVRKANFAGLLEIAKERATDGHEHADAKGRLIGYTDSTSSSSNDFDWIHIEFESSYDGGILAFRYFFPVGDLENATEEQIENKLIENWCLTSHLQSIGLRNLHKFWDKEKNEMVYELRYALSDVIEHPHATTQLFFCIATEEDSEDENKRYRLKRERYAIEAMEG